MGPEDTDTSTAFGNPVDLGDKVGDLRGLKHVFGFCLETLKVEAEMVTEQ